MSEKQVKPWEQRGQSQPPNRVTRAVEPTTGRTQAELERRIACACIRFPHLAALTQVQIVVCRDPDCSNPDHTFNYMRQFHNVALRMLIVDIAIMERGFGSSHLTGTDSLRRMLEALQHELMALLCLDDRDQDETRTDLLRDLAGFHELYVFHSEEPNAPK